MKYFIVLLLVTANFISAFCQPEVIYETGLMGILRDASIRYPPDDRRKGIYGTVLLKFRIRPDKSIDSISVVNSASPALDAEAIRGMKQTSGRWLTNEDRYYLFAISFSINPPDTPDDEYYRKNADKFLKEGNYKKAAPYLASLKRRNPLNVAVLDELADVYRRLGEVENESAIRQLRNTVIKFKNEKRIIGQDLPRD